MLNTSRLILILALALLATPTRAQEETALPAAVTSSLKAPLYAVGTGNYRKFGITIYAATFWAEDAEWNPKKPYALQMRYTHAVSQSTMADTVIDDIRDQHVTDEPTFTRWEATLRSALPAVKVGDEMVGLHIPGQDSRLYLNGKEITRIKDTALAQAFFNIWFGPNADSRLKQKLLGNDA